MIYIVYLILLLILLKLERRKASTNNVFRYIIPAVYIFLVGLRGANVGVDTPVYYDHYYTFGEWGCSFVEIGFDWLNRFIYHLGYSHAPFFCICATLTVVPVVVAVNDKLSRQEYSIFMLLFCTTTFVSMCNGMRQNMACGILFFTLVWYENTSAKLSNRVIIYMLGILIASLFHVSVIFIAPIIFLKYLHLSNKQYVSIYILSFMFLFVKVSSFIPEIQISNRDYSGYVDTNFANQSASSLGFFISTLKNILFLTILVKSRLFEKYALWSNLTFLTLVFLNVEYSVPLIGRINMYFVFFSTVMLAIVFANRNEYKNTNNIIMQLLILIVLVMSVYGYVSTANKLLPYNFYWETPDYSKYLKF